MAKCGENIYKRKDGRWEGRFIRGRKENGHAIYGYVYGRSYTECKGKLKEAAIAPPRMMCGCRLTAKELFSSLLRKKCAEVKPSTAQRYRHQALLGSDPGADLPDLGGDAGVCEAG